MKSYPENNPAKEQNAAPVTARVWMAPRLPERASRSNFPGYPGFISGLAMIPPYAAVQNTTTNIPPEGKPKGPSGMNNTGDTEESVDRPTLQDEGNESGWDEDDDLYNRSSERED